MRDQQFSDVNVRAEAGMVLLEFKSKVTSAPIRVVLGRMDATRIANALKVCATAPEDLVTNFDIRTD